MDYSKLSDEELVFKAQGKDESAMTELISRYKHYVKKSVRPYFLAGGDSEDLIQEGMLGVFRAIETFNGKSGFKSYVYLCVKTGIISLIKKYNSDKNKPLNNFVSLNEGEPNAISEVAATAVFNPETSVINSESEKELVDKMKDELSKLEFNILTLYLEGYSYAEIGEKIGKNEKSIDNALQRIRKKVAHLYGE